ncbi:MULTISPECIES: transposase [Holospora]
MDDASFHKGIEKQINYWRALAIHYCTLPSYSPDLNPIEKK